jgi:hypothetical protein
MKKSLWQLSLIASVAGFALVGQAPSLRAAEDDERPTGEQMQRLERRLNELAQRQEQIIRRMEAGMDRQGPGGPNQPAGGALVQRGMRAQQMLPPGAEAGPVFQSAPQPARQRANAGADQPIRHELEGLVHVLLLIGLICNLLLASWIFMDIRKRGDGPGIFVALALLAGIPSALIYALVRIGDRKA